MSDRSQSLDPDTGASSPQTMSDGYESSDHEPAHLILKDNPTFDRIAKALTSELPYTGGTLDVGTNDLIFFYEKDAKNAGYA